MIKLKSIFLFLFLRPTIACDSKDCVTIANQKSTDFCQCLGANSSSAPSIDKRLKFKLKRPLLKSIVLNKQPELPVINIKQEPFDDDYSNLNKVSHERLTSEANMQFDKKHNKQINSYFKINDSDNVRSYSPPLPKSSRITPSVSNNSHHMAAASTEAKEVRPSRERKSSKKKKRRRRSYSKCSRSRSRSRYVAYVLVKPNSIDKNKELNKPLPFLADHIPDVHDVHHQRPVPDPHREVPNTKIVHHRNVTIVDAVVDVPKHAESRRKKNVIPTKDPIQKSIQNHLLMSVIKVSILIQLILHMHSIRNKILCQHNVMKTKEI